MKIQNLTIYLDDIINATDTYSIIPQISINRIRIGSRLDGNSAFNGSIDEVYYYNRVLTPSEIFKLSK